jgi:Transglutaminase-like superfamily
VKADLASLRAAWWALRAVRSVRRQLRSRPVAEVRPPGPPALPARAKRGVEAVLRRLEPSCLERALVLQRWLAAHGEPRVVVIGVTAPGDFRAHAWLEGEPAPGFHEIARVGA